MTKLQFGVSVWDKRNAWNRIGRQCVCRNSLKKKIISQVYGYRHGDGFNLFWTNYDRQTYSAYSLLLLAKYIQVGDYVAACHFASAMSAIVFCRARRKCVEEMGNIINLRVRTNTSNVACLHVARAFDSVAPTFHFAFRYLFVFG